MKKCLLFFVLFIFLTRTPAQAETMQVWEIITDEGAYLTSICEEPSAGDEYITDENTVYEIVAVTENQAIARKSGMAELPSLSWMDSDAAMPVSATSRRIALYCTHSDESYEPSDGFYSTTKRGSIYQVGRTLADALEAEGIEVSFADTLHHPHDAGAYRRSRQTAVQLLKQGLPDCLIDIHRDGIPDPESYAVNIGGEEASKIRILVGRGNQNAAVNKEFALMVKAVADRIYPGLIKDIYMGKGTYNQDLAPRSVLLEFGTHTLDKKLVSASVNPMSEVVYKALFGGEVGSAGESDVSSRKASENTEKEMVPPASEDNTGSGTAVWLIVALVAGLAIFAFLSTGGKGGMQRFSRSFSEMTGGLFGKKPPKDK